MISAKFHNTLVRLFRGACEQLRSVHGLDRVVLSGGCFQNARLLVALSSALETSGFQVFTQSAVPSNDGGIALGQAMAADAIYKAGMAGVVSSNPR
jgi:hydrogenase maturation protein HypF